MTAVTQILSQIEQGDPHAAEQLLPLVYEELRTRANRKMANEAAGQTLSATGLVHEAFMRLVGGGDEARDIGRLGHDQVASYARRKGQSVGDVERWLTTDLAYEPSRS